MTHISSEQQTFLEAIALGNISEVQNFIDTLGVHYQVEGSRWTLLHHGAFWEQHSCLSLLIEAGIDLNRQDEFGRTALHHACNSGHKESVAVLINAGIDINIQDVYRETAMDLGAQHSNSEIVTLLEQRRLLPDEFKVRLEDIQHEEWDQVCFECETKTPMNATWRKDGLPLADHVVSSSAGAVHRVEIDSVNLDDEGRYMCKLGNGQNTAGKLTVKAVFDEQQNWNRKEKDQMVRTCVAKILTAGKYQSGKTSLARSLHKSKGIVCRLDDRTIVLNYHTWRFTEGQTIPVYDVGGHTAYSYITHFFHHNSRTNIVLLVHDIELIDEADYKITFIWMNDILTHSPTCVIIPVLCKTDKIQEKEIEERKQKFSARIIEYIEEEIEYLRVQNKVIKEESIKFLSEALQRNLEVFQLGNLHAVSCKSGFGLENLREHIGREITDSEINHFMLMPIRWNLFYQKCGLLGVAAPQQKTASERKMEHKPSKNKDAIADVTSKSQVKGDNLEHVDLSDSNAEDSEDTLEDSDALATSNEKNNLIDCSPINYIHFDDAFAIYTNILKVLPAPEDEKEDFQKCLSFLHSRGLLFWFKNVSKLVDIIFHDINSFADLIKTVFDHRIKEEIFTHDVILGKIVSGESLIANKEKLLKTGVMSKHILHLLLKRVNFEEHYDTVVALLQKLNITYQIPNTENWFIPWFCSNNEQPQCLQSELKAMKSSRMTSISLISKLIGHIPETLFYQLCITTMSFLNGRDNIYLWSGNLWAKVNDLKIHLNHEERIVNTVCNTANIGSVRLMWEFLKYLHEERTILQKAHWPGFISDVIVLCPACILTKVDESCESFFLEDLLIHSSTEMRGNVHYCPNCGDIPAAFLHPICKDDTKATVCLKKVEEYIIKQTEAEKAQENESTLEIPTLTPEQSTSFHRSDTIPTDSTVNDLPENSVENESPSSVVHPGERDKIEMSQMMTQMEVLPKQTSSTERLFVEVNRISRTILQKQEVFSKQLSRTAEQLSRQQALLSTQMHSSSRLLSQQAEENKVLMSKQVEETKVEVAEVRAELLCKVDEATSEMTEQLGQTTSDITEVVGNTESTLLRGVMLEAGDASGITVECQNPILKEFEQCFEKNFEPTEDTLKKLWTHCVISSDESMKIKGQKSNLGKTKLILMILNNHKSNEILKDFAGALKETTKNNEVLSNIITEALDDI